MRINYIFCLIFFVTSLILASNSLSNSLLTRISKKEFDSLQVDTICREIDNLIYNDSMTINRFNVLISDTVINKNIVFKYSGQCDIYNENGNPIEITVPVKGTKDKIVRIYYNDLGIEVKREYFRFKIECFCWVEV